ncbi:MAG: protein kinase, partial [Deltaproteobacteria bacterium]|nr:protein kinase [Deltaproteobacteria bacterium]MBW2534443.1 protein kinase [Deltaproteobacteria bacterium]
MGEPVDVTNLEPGTVLLNKYRVVETLGIGGMGVVVAADHLMLATRVALKFLLPKLLSNEQVAERFMREARAAIRIDSSHVCKVIDVDTLPDGPPFMVMEYLQGEDLAFLVDSGRRFAIEEAIDLIVQAAEALAQAHKVGIVHRDVKPANLFLVERGEEPAVVKVLDFGISKVMDDGDFAEQAALTKTTAVLGSGLYMSPEQMRSAKNVDRRTDVYALGVCLFELLTHTLPYTADSFAELCVKVSTEPPEPLRKYRPDVSEELAQVIAKAYTAKPDDRYQSIAEFAEALAPYSMPTSQATIDHIAIIGDRPTSPSMSVPPPAAPSDSGQQLRLAPGQTTAASADDSGQYVRTAPGHTTTGASASLARTAAAEAPKRAPVGMIVAASVLLLGTVAAAVGLGLYGISPPHSEAETSAAMVTADPATAETTETAAPDETTETAAPDGTSEPDDEPEDAG